MDIASWMPCGGILHDDMQEGNSLDVRQIQRVCAIELLLPLLSGVADSACLPYGSENIGIDLEL